MIGSLLQPPCSASPAQGAIGKVGVDAQHPLAVDSGSITAGPAWKFDISDAGAAAWSRRWPLVSTCSERMVSMFVR